MKSPGPLLTRPDDGETRSDRVATLFQFIRFGLVGVLNTLVGLFVIWGLMAMGVPMVWANAGGYATGLVVSLTLNKKFTFGSSARWRRIVPRFALVTLVAYVVNLTVVMVSANAFMVDRYLSQLFGMPFYTLMCFLGYRHFVFGRDR